MKSNTCTSYLVFVLVVLTRLELACGGLRDGFNSQMDSEYKAEMQMGDGEAMQGMSREMFQMQDADWEIQPPKLENLSPSMKSHILKYLDEPVKLTLQRRRGKYGMRAIGELPSGQKLRAYWRQGAEKRMRSSEFLHASYDDAVRSRLSMVEFELQLPPLKKSKKLTSVVYSVAVETGSLTSKAIVPRGSGRIKVYPSGHDGDSVEAGKGVVGLKMKAGLIDPGWAKGKRIFRKGRPVGVI